MVKAWKVEKVDLLQRSLLATRTAAVVSMHGLPARQLQTIRKGLAGRLDLFMTRKRLMALALANLPGKAGIDKLSEHMVGESALVLSDLDPFKLFKALEASKVRSPAKPGAVAPSDIVVPPGDTGMPPGPMIGELGKLGIKAAVQKGTIHVTAEKLLVKQGDTVTAEAAALLSKLNINPMEIGLEITAAYEDGVVFLKRDLAIDEGAYLDQIALAQSWAMNLAMEAAIATRETAEPLLSKAHRDAVALATHIIFLTPETAPAVLQRANAQCLSLAREVAARDPSALSDEERAALAAQPSAGPAAPAKEAGKAAGPAKEKAKAEEKGEEEAVSGLGALFG